MLIRQKGYSLLELSIAMVILGFAMAIAMPNFSAWITNLQIRSAAEKIQAGIQFARGEALRSNAPVSFYLMSDASSGCVLSSAGPVGIVSKVSPVSACDAEASDSASPFLVRKDVLASNSTTIVATGVGGASSSITFSGIGRIVTSSPWISEIVVDAPPASTFRKLKIQVKAGGKSKICDPAVVSVVDSRRCD